MDIVTYLPAFLIGLVTGLIVMFIVYRLRGSAADPAAVKREFEDYRAKVDAHFDQTGEKFRSLSEQYQNLYQHLAVGANELCGEESASKMLEKQPSNEVLQQSEEVANTNQPTDDVVKQKSEKA